MKMSRVKLFGALALLASLTIAASTFWPTGAFAQKRLTTPPADLKVRSRMITGGADRGIETITYIKGARMRSEMGVTAMGTTNIMQCDLRRTIMLNNQTRTYMITPLDASGDAGAVAAPGVPPAAQPQTEKRRGGVVNVVNTITDTGERKEMFGFTARRIKTSMVMEASPDACNPGSSRIETDGWYIDFEYDFNCPGQKPVVHRPGVPVRPDCQDEVRTRTIGSAKLGYPVLVTTTTMHQGDGTTTTMTQEVLEISRAPLDVALFDIPAGYTLARSMQEMYGVSGAAANADTRPNDAGAAENATAPGSQTAAATGVVAANAPKKEGAVRICQMMPKAQVTTGSAAQAAEAVRNAFASYLTGPRLEIASLNARLPSQAMEEARQSQCDHVLYASITQKKGGGGGMFSRAVGNVVGAAVGHIPVSTAGEAAARGAVITGVYTTANIASNIKAKDEITLEYKLEAVGEARPALSKTEKARATADGEDVLTPLIERAAEAIVAAATK